MGPRICVVSLSLSYAERLFAKRRALSRTVANCASSCMHSTFATSISSSSNSIDLEEGPRDTATATAVEEPEKLEPLEAVVPAVPLDANATAGTQWKGSDSESA